MRVNLRPSSTGFCGANTTEPAPALRSDRAAGNVLSYSTDRVDGSGGFGAGAQTEISVPSIEYPNGYQVNVTGGHVISAPNSPTPVIASNSGADTVNVAVTPAAG